MDSGWAAIIGAGIALLGASVIPWVREAITARRQREADRRARLAEALESVVVAMNSMLKARTATSAETIQRPDLVESMMGTRPNIAEANGWEMEPVLARLSLLLTTEERPILKIAQNTIGGLQRSATWTAGQPIHVVEAVTFLRAFRTTSAAWYSGDIPIGSVESTYDDAARSALEKVLRSNP